MFKQNKWVNIEYEREKISSQGDKISKGYGDSLFLGK